MNRALLYLYTRTLAGSLRQRLVRLKRPKYLFGAIFGGLYFYAYFYRFLFLGQKGVPPMPGEASGLSESLAALVLFAALLVFAWIVPGKRTALIFSEAEIATLFPAPLSRRELIRYKLLTSQIGIFFFAVLMTLITGRGATGSGWLHLAGWWVIISVFSLHRLGASFALTRLMERGMANWQRRVALLAGLAALAGGFAAWRALAPAPPELRTLRHADAFFAYIDSVLLAGPGPWLLLPFRVVVRPYFAADWAAFGIALWPALGVLMLHYWWVMRADVSFEEASVALAQRRSNLMAARQKGGQRVALAPRSAKDPAFPLRPVGWKTTAFVWKALLYSGGRGTLRIWSVVIVASLAAAVGLILFWPSDGLALGVGIAGGAVFCVVLFANITSGASYLRQDLEAMDLLQTFPIRGWQIVLGQLFPQAALGALVQWAALALGVMGWMSLAGVMESNGGAIVAACAAVAVLALPFNLAMMIIPAGTLLLWPGWFKSGPQAAGFETAGLRIILMLGQVLAMGFALILPALAGGAVWFAALFFHADLWWMPLAGTAAALVLAGEAWLGILGLGALFERFDVSAE